MLNPHFSSYLSKKRLFRQKLGGGAGRIELTTLGLFFCKRILAKRKHILFIRHFRTCLSFLLLL